MAEICSAACLVFQSIVTLVSQSSLLEGDGFGCEQHMPLPHPKTYNVSQREQGECELRTVLNIVRC